MNKKEFIGVWVPAEILLDSKLTDKEKLILSIICNLSQNNNYCYASNRYFSNLLNVTIGRISKWITSLKSKNYIDIEIVYKAGTKEIQNRIIKIIKAELIPIVKNDYRYSQYRLEGIVNNDQDIKKNNIKIYKYRGNFEQRQYTEDDLNKLYINNSFSNK